MSVDTIMSYMSALTNPVDKKVSSMLQEKFVLTFDRSFGLTTHFVCVFAVFSRKDPCGYKSVFSFIYSEDNHTLNARTHIEFIDFVLPVSLNKDVKM